MGKHSYSSLIKNTFQTLALSLFCWISNDFESLNQENLTKKTTDKAPNEEQFLPAILLIKLIFMCEISGMSL